MKKIIKEYFKDKGKKDLIELSKPNIKILDPDLTEEKIGKVVAEFKAGEKAFIKIAQRVSVTTSDVKEIYTAMLYRLQELSKTADSGEVKKPKKVIKEK